MGTTTRGKIKIKPVGSSEIKDPKIIREVIAEIRRAKTPEERAAHEADMEASRELLRRAMAK
jgi:hypothetical protein